MPEPKNVELEVEGDVLAIKVDLTKDYGPSKSGKTRIVATTSGTVGVPGREEVRIGLNVFTK